MIKVFVKLHGTLPSCVPGYHPEKGLTLELAQGARVLDLTTRLNIAQDHSVVVAMAGRVAKPEDAILDGADIRIFQLALGG